MTSKRVRGSRDWAESVVPGFPLPELAWPVDVVGTVHDRGAEATGIPPGTPVIAGTIDCWAEAASVGVRSHGELMLQYGSTVFLVLGVTSAANHPALWTTRGVDPGSLTVAAGLATGGSLTDWLREILGEPSFEELLAEAERAAPGARGLLVLPYFAGERTPILDPHARGTIMGLTLRHNRGDIYRAVLEGIAMGIRHNLETMDSRSGLRAVAVGGGTKAELWLQIVSDVTGLTQEVPSVTIGASYGDALLAAEGAGIVAPRTSWFQTGSGRVAGPCERRRLRRDVHALPRALSCDARDPARTRRSAAPRGGSRPITGHGRSGLGALVTGPNPGGGRPMPQFNGLGMNMGNLARLSGAQTRSITPENFSGAKGKGGMATEGTGAAYARRSRAGLEDLALRDRPGRRDVRAREHRRIGRDPADLDDACGQLAAEHPPHLLGRPGAAVRGVPGRRFLRHGLGHVRAALVTGCLRQSGQRLQLLLGDAVPQARAHHAREHLLLRAAALLPDQLHADRCSRRPRLLPQPVPQGQPAAVQGGVHDPGRDRGPRPVRRQLPGLGRQQRRVVGGGRDQVLHRRRRRMADDLRHRDRGLLLRVVQLREQGDQAVPGVHDALRGAPPGDPAGRALSVAAAIRDVPLAHRRPDPLPGGPARHDPGARVAGGSADAGRSRRPALSPPPGRHRLRRLLVPDAADRAVPGASGPGLPRSR